MRLLVLAPALLLVACATSDSSPEPESDPLGVSTPSMPAVDGFDAQAWLAEARAFGFDPESSGYDDDGTDRMKALSAELNEAADWRRACDTYLDYETGEEIYEPTPPGEGHWVRGTFEIGDVSETEAVVAITCDFGAYQGSYAFVHIAGDRVALLTAPSVDEEGQPSGPADGTFSTPDFSRLGTGFLSTFAKARGLADCGLYVTYAMGEGSTLSVHEVRERDCGDDIPDDLPSPEEWPVVYTAE